MRLEFTVEVDGFAGIGTDFNFNRDWQRGEGIVLRMRASEEGLPLNLVLHLEDATQTSTQLPGVAPFGCAFTTPAGSVDDWVLVTVGWDCFQRLTWMGTEGRFDFTAQPVSSFEVAFEGTLETPVSGTIWIDDIRVISETDLNIPPSIEDVLGIIPPIRASQIGYRPQDPKTFVTNVPGRTFTVVDAETGEVAFEGELRIIGYDGDVQDNLYHGSFDALTEPGIYQIVLQNGEESYPFEIGDDAYAETMRIAARVFYLQRSGITIDDADDSGFAFEAGHTEPAVLWGDDTNTPIDVTGGWYDAGDFGRYIPTGTFAVNQLLYAFNANPDVFADGSLNIPESSNGIPDLLDEIRWELDWLLKMQREDGAVHHKVTTRSFPGFGTLPVEDGEQMFVFDVSSADAAYFAAAMAQASRTYREYDAEYADQLLEAAERAWAWLSQHPEQFPEGGFQNPPVSEYPMQGGYDFVGVEDVPRMWASAELFNATGDAAYEEAFIRHFSAAARTNNHSMNWANSYPMGLYAYLTAENANPDTHAEVGEVFQEQAQRIFEVVEDSGYNVALTDSETGFEFVWGSNQVALAHGLYLMLAHELFPNEGYPEAALAQIQYVLGANPLAKAYISGIGSNPMLYPHHNLSYREQRAVPGFITEGSNSQGAGGDSVLLGLWDIGVPSAMRYVDDWDSWASNEPTIDANATFVALLAYFMD
jgi:endoglucanase